jgi:hypothetical protein
MILYSSIATRVVVGTLGRGTSGSVEVFRVGLVEVFGVCCIVAVSIMVSKLGEDLFASMSSFS